MFLNWMKMKTKLPKLIGQSVGGSQREVHSISCPKNNNRRALIFISNLRWQLKVLKKKEKEEGEEVTARNNQIQAEINEIETKEKNRSNDKTKVCSLRKRIKLTKQ